VSVGYFPEAPFEIVNAVFLSDIVDSEFRCEAVQLFLELHGNKAADCGFLQARSELGALAFEGVEIRIGVPEVVRGGPEFLA
jgi:hypothetical protein